MLSISETDDFLVVADRHLEPSVKLESITDSNVESKLLHCEIFLKEMSFVFHLSSVSILFNFTMPDEDFYIQIFIIFNYSK